MNLKHELGHKKYVDDSGVREINVFLLYKNRLINSIAIVVDRRELYAN